MTGAHVVLGNYLERRVTTAIEGDRALVDEELRKVPTRYR